MIFTDISKLREGRVLFHTHKVFYPRIHLLKLPKINHSFFSCSFAAAKLLTLNFNCDVTLDYFIIVSHKRIVFDTARPD